MRGVGVDGCRGGWLVVRMEGNARGNAWGKIALCPTYAGAMEAAGEQTTVFVDIPIGLPWRDCPRREADVLARAFLGRGRSSSIFNPPARVALAAETYAEASRLNRRETGLGLSCQSYNILPKIREADHWLRNHPQQTARVLEAHPEVVFSCLGPDAPRHPKKKPEGHAERLELLEGHCPGATELAGRARDTYLRRQCAPDDVLDAMALALAARHHATKPDRFPPMDRALPRDQTGLPMAIHYARPE